MGLHYTAKYFHNLIIYYPPTDMKINKSCHQSNTDIAKDLEQI